MYGDRRTQETNVARTPKPKPIASFETNMADAMSLVAYAQSFTNRRKRRMRSELRNGIGEVLKIAQKDRAHLDCLESDDLFVVFKPSAHVDRDGFSDLRPLLRQALVAGCAALETYVADTGMKFVGAALRSDEPPRRIQDIPLSVGRWLEIEEQYERKGWGLRRVVEEHFREISSPAPSQIGAILSSIGVVSWAKKVDAERGVTQGNTVTELDRITARRNRIAHTGDRVGQGRASLEVNEVQGDLAIITEVVEAIDQILASHSV